MIIGEPAASPSRASVRSDDDAIDGFRRFDLEPEFSSIARHVRAAQSFGHQSFMTGCKSLAQKNLGCCFVVSNNSVRQEFALCKRCEFRPACFVSFIDKRMAVQIEAIERMKRKRDIDGRGLNSVNPRPSISRFLFIFS